MAFLSGSFVSLTHSAPAFRNAASTCSLSHAVLMNSSCLAPALRAMAFHPFCVGTVTRIFTFPLASRTGRITPGITDRISGLADSSSSRIGRTPSMMLCSIFNRSLEARRRMRELPDDKVAIVLADGHARRRERRTRHADLARVGFEMLDLGHGEAVKRDHFWMGGGGRRPVA